MWCVHGKIVGTRKKTYTSKDADRWLYWHATVVTCHCTVWWDRPHPNKYWKVTASAKKTQKCVNRVAFYVIDTHVCLSSSRTGRNKQQSIKFLAYRGTMTAFLRRFSLFFRYGTLTADVTDSPRYYYSYRNQPRSNISRQRGRLNKELFMIGFLFVLQLFFNFLKLKKASLHLSHGSLASGKSQNYTITTKCQVWPRSVSKNLSWTTPLSVCLIIRRRRLQTLTVVNELFTYPSHKYDVVCVTLRRATWV